MASLAAVLYPPPTKQGWNDWAHANFQHHLAIRSGIVAVKGVIPTPYRIWPVSDFDFSDWEEQHQQEHSLMNQILGISGQDLSDIDRQDRRKLDAWMFAHFIQHQAAAQILKIPIT